ncbi:MAG: hypothetical protein HC927_08095 [Deltaproteobacteria bacterium]|nr:hypothetical protein [Deltaproteobacteria bacterium]
MTKFERNLSILLLTLSSPMLGCTDDGVEPADDEAAESEGSCTPGEQGCECYLGFCEPGSECVANFCVDPDCVLGSESCPCAEDDQCFSGLECIAGICSSTSDETTDGSTTDESTTDGSTTDGSTTDASTTTDESTTDESTTDASTDGCSPDAYTQCVGNSVVYFDSCDVQGDVLETCSGGQVCVDVSASAAECQERPIACGNGVIDPGEDCDGNLPGNVSCMSLGFDGGPLACAANCSYDESECFYCECTDGACCDGCDFRPANYVCEASAETQYGCPNGTDPGDDVSKRTRDRYCSGNSASCSGGFGSWSAWSVIDSCSNDEYCTPGDSTCNPCTYDVTQYECSTFSPANGNGLGGGEIFRICASTNPQGFMTVKARKLDNSTFSNRPYQVRVSAPGDDPAGRWPTIS